MAFFPLLSICLLCSENWYKQGGSEITIEGSKPIDASKIRGDIVNESLGQILKNMERIKDLGNNYKGGQLEQNISKLLNADLQKENINSNYNDGEPIFQTREEALNYPQQKKNIHLNPAGSTTPQGQVSSSPPRSNIKEACSSQHIASIVKQPN